MSMFVTLALAAAAAPMASEPPTDNRVLHYLVRKNDSLDNLARRYFVSYKTIQQVVAANHMGMARKLTEHETLLIPYRILRWTGVNGQVASFRGAVRVGAKNASIGNVIDEGDRIETAANSFVALQFPDGSITTLPSNSRIRAVSMRRYTITGEVDRRFVVESGGSEWRVSPSRGAGDRFEVRTPVATTAVRGTEFRVTYAETGGQSGAGVVKGEVAFGTQKSDQPVSLPVGFGAVTDASGTIDKRELLPAPTMAQGYALQRAETVSLTAVPVEGAKAYQFEIANDSSFLDPVTTVTSDSPTGKVDTLADGQYFLRVSALDNASLQGLSRTYVFARKLLVLSAAPDGASGRLKFSWTKGPTGTIGYRFALSNHDDMAQPLVDATVADGNQIAIGPLAPGHYFWRVTTFSAGSDDQSDIQPFELGAP